MITFYDYAGACWWCAGEADSREHKYKRSDLKQEFGPGPWRGDEGPVRVVEGDVRAIQGPNSREVKFGATLCGRCNSARSQPFDRAHEIFTGYVGREEESILATGVFRFPDVFGVDWRLKCDDLIRYLAKHVCCRLVDAGVRIDPGVIRFLEGDRRLLPCISLGMEIREDIAAMGTDSGGSLWLGDLKYLKNQWTGSARCAYAFLGYRWLRINYAYDEGVRSPTRLPRKTVRLGRGANVDPHLVRARARTGSDSSDR